MRFAVFLLATTAAFAQTATVTGRVLTSEGKPMPKVTVRVVGEADKGVAPAYVGTTGPDGTFTTKDLPPGGYSVVAERFGYRTLQTGARIIPEFTVKAGDTHRVELRLQALGVVAGTVVDQDGNPVFGAEVLLQRPMDTNNGRQLVQVGSDMTDDRGQFRITQVSPDSYYLVVSEDVNQLSRQGVDISSKRSQIPGPSARRTNLRTYYPEAAEVEAAEALKVGPKPIENLVVRMRQGGGYKVRARMVGGPADGSGSIDLWVQEGLNYRYYRMKRLSGGFYEVASVPPGTYQLMAFQGVPSAMGQDVVEVKDRDVEDLTVQMQAPFTISGKFLYDGKLPDGIRFSMSATEPINTTSVSGIKVEPDGTFRIEGVSARRYRYVSFSTTPFAGFYVKAIRIGGRELKSGEVLDLTEGTSEPWEVEWQFRPETVRQ